MPSIDATSASSGMDAILSGLYTSPEEEERQRRASVQKQRIMAVGDALRHVGNIVNTVGYAPVQTFTRPVEEEAQKYKTEKLTRDVNNLRVMSYLQAKEAQDARMQAAEATRRYNALKDAATLSFRREQLDATRENNEENRKLREQIASDRLRANTEHWAVQDAERERHNRVGEGIQQQNATSNRMRAEKYAPGGGGSGSRLGDYETTTETTHEPEVVDPITGEVKKWKSRTVRKRTGSTNNNAMPGVVGVDDGLTMPGVGK